MLVSSDMCMKQIAYPRLKTIAIANLASNLLLGIWLRRKLQNGLIYADQGELNTYIGRIDFKSERILSSPDPLSLSQTFISYRPHPTSRNRNVTLGSNRLR